MYRHNQYCTGRSRSRPKTSSKFSSDTQSLRTMHNGGPCSMQYDRAAAARGAL